MRTRITELLGIEHPVIQAPTNPVAVPRLAAAVSEAGGLGMLACNRYTDEQLREDIRTIRELTDKPFGVNLVAGIPGYEQVTRVLIEERVPVICHGRGNPKWLVEATKGEGIVVIPIVGAVRHAVRAEQDGAHAIIVAGLEAGGHVSYISTMVLLPLVASKVSIPVIAAGGFCDGKGLVASLALGAEGIAMGTRFAVTRESGAPWNIKERYVKSDETETVVTPAITGTRLRVLRNKLTDLLEQPGKGLSYKERIFGTLETRRRLGVSWWQFITAGWRMRKAYEASFSQLGNLAAGSMRIDKAFVEGDEEFGAMPSGQVCGRIDDVPTAREIIERIMGEARTVLASIASQIPC